MTTDTLKLYAATQTLFRAFHYLGPRMEGGDLVPPQAMNAEALAGRILHGCMAQLLRELQQRRERHQTQTMPAFGWHNPNPAPGQLDQRHTL
jgi:hypothetical protein